MMAKREVALDTETTGLNKDNDRIIELACVEMIDRMPTGKVLNFLINPGLDDDGNQIHITEETTKIHGLTDRDVEGKPIFDDIADEFLDFIEDSPLVIHNAPFDIRFLNASLARVFKNRGLKYNKIPNPIVDTLILARKQRPRSQNSLDALCRHYNIDRSSRKNRHGALIDTELLVRVYKKLYEVNEGFDFSSSKKTVYVSRPFRPSRKIRTLSEEDWLEHVKYMDSIKDNVWNALNERIENGKNNKKQEIILEDDQDDDEEDDMILPESELE